MHDGEVVTVASLLSKIGNEQLASAVFFCTMVAEQQYSSCGMGPGAAVMAMVAGAADFE